MTERCVTHATFAIERTYPAAPSRVFAAWSDPAAKAAWFGAPGEESPLQLDFRVGGVETLTGGPADGPVFTYAARYQDIVDDERIVYTYEMTMNGERISVSVATVEFRGSSGGTTLVFTEQGAYLDGHDTPEQREHGTREMLGALGTLLERETASA